MSYFLKRGNTFIVTDEDSVNLHYELPIGNYVVKKDQFGDLYLEAIDSFRPVSKVYGKSSSQVDRILQTFEHRTVSTGVLLNGEKGSGKTLMAKMLSIQCAGQGIPTIVVNTPFCDDKFFTLIQSITQPVVVLFDEFEKVYDWNDQKRVLTLLDGVFPSKKLFVLTVNDKWAVDEHMRNRPGRIYYLLDFGGVDHEFVVDYCQDNLTDKSQIEAVCKVSTMFNQFNFDMLQSLVEEMNRFGESPYDALKMLNAKPTSDDGSQYSVSLEVDGVSVPAGQVSPAVFEGNPLAIGTVNITYDPSLNVLHSDAEPQLIGYASNQDCASPSCTPVDPPSNKQNQIRFTVSDITHLDASAGVIKFKKNNRVVTLTRMSKYQFNFGDF